MSSQFSHFKSINDIIDLSLKEKEQLFSDKNFRQFCKKKFFSNSFIESDSYDINNMTQIVSYYTTNSNFGLYHNLKNVALVKKLQNSKFYLSNDFLLGLIPEKLFISVKTIDFLMKELSYIKKPIFTHCMALYLEFIVDENKNDWLHKLLQIWNNNCSIQDKFPINSLIKALRFECLVNVTRSKTKEVDKESVNKIISEFEKQRRMHLRLILGRRTKMNFEIELIFEFLFRK